MRMAGVSPRFGGSQTKVAGASLIQQLDVVRNRRDRFLQDRLCSERTASPIGDDGITDVIAAHLDHVQRVRWNATTVIGQKRLHLIREIEIASVVVGARGADGIVGGLQAVRSKRRPNVPASRTERANCSTHVAPLLK